MCGRSSLTKTEKELEERFNATFYSEDLERYNPLPNYNVAPTHMHPVITNIDHQHLSFFRWGLIPFWAKDVKIGYKMINSRLETILTKPSFRNAVKKRRCLVPFDGFYEWKKSTKGKIPFRFITTNTAIFCIAGIWESWKSPEGELIHSFSLITHNPNALVSQVHDRMPAILLPEDEKNWIDPELPVEDALRLIEDPYPAELMRGYTVSKRVNNVRENDSTLIEEIHYEDDTLSLF